VIDMRVLIVDDDGPSRYLVSAILKGYGHEVVEACDGIEALELARSMPVDLCVSDILMPNMDGYALCREWKADLDLSPIPLVFYTSTYKEPEDERFAAALGADGFFTKPQEPEKLVALLAEAVGGGTADRPTLRTAEPRDENEVLREYNERLVSKLERKVMELDRANRDLGVALEVISEEAEVKRSLIEKLTADVVARDRQHQELAAANETLEAILAASPVAVVSVAADWTITSWNPAAERALGWTAEETIGSDSPRFVADGREEMREFYAPLMRGEVQQVTGRGARRRKDGGTVELLTRAVPLHDSNGAVRGILAMMQDVSEETAVETVKSAFVSMVSHELRTPLTAIIGYTELLARTDPGDRPGLHGKFVDRIGDRADRMRRLVDELLLASQIQSGPLRLDLQGVDPAELASVAIDGAEPSELHTLVLDAEPGVARVLVDPEQMSVVLAQLVSNAVKYSPDGGDVTVRTSVADGHARLSVSDEGIGIEPSDMAHIFDSFTQADMSDARRFGGVGVGLFLARQIVQAHNGRIEVESEPGKGSLFTVVLPLVG
jgi:PAS domain S-box-containing protein